MKITIEVKELEESAMFFNEEFGTGEFDGEKFEAVHALPTKSLIVKYKGKRYMVETQKLMRAILENAHGETK